MKIGYISAIIVLAILMPITTNATTITVGPGGSYDYSRIQEAIDAARAGDVIEVHNGTYSENVNVNKQITLRGVDSPAVDTGRKDEYDSAINLSADGIRLEGFTVVNSSGGSSYAGAIKVNSNNNIVIGNDVKNIIGDGIHFSPHVRNNTIVDNNIIDNARGIYLEDSNNDNIFTGNNISNSYGNGIHLYKSSNNIIKDNIILNNGYGGIILYDSSNNIAACNNISYNIGGGIDLANSSYNIFTGNYIRDSYQDGVYLDKDSSNNTLYLNSLVDNELVDAYDNSINQWDNGTNGNYYSDFICKAGDDICSSAYKIPGNGSSVDRYPLTKPTICPPGAELISMENDIDRPGNDYRSFDPSSPDPALCKKACADDPNCKAFTYVKPGFQGSSARCWLKNAVPSAVSNSCCISGVK